MREVVAVAVTTPGRVLAARRSSPPALAGRWELPGGKVDPGETLETAGAREVAEELGCRVEVTGRLEGRSVVGADLSLVAEVAPLVSGDPVPHDHGAVRWLRVDQLDEVDWVEAYRVFLPSLRRLLGGPPVGERVG